MNPQKPSATPLLWECQETSASTSVDNNGTAMHATLTSLLRPEEHQDQEQHTLLGLLIGVLFRCCNRRPKQT
jgi:hypothetical protein